MQEEPRTFIFQLGGTKDTCEIKAENSAEAFLRCLREKMWPVDLVIYMGQKEVQSQR